VPESKRRKEISRKAALISLDFPFNHQGRASATTTLSDFASKWPEN
jgi:hypothetical protein